jgi:nucleotidyltransferase substrate binding protein (TIGR01987 family)
MRELLKSYKDSLDRLKEVLRVEKSLIQRDASIQRFEFTVELAWKIQQTFLREKGIECRSPKDCLKESFKYGLLPDNPLWLNMIEDRNLTVHTYDERTAEKVYGRVALYIPLFEALENALQKLQAK